MTTPDEEPTVATPVFELLQVPPEEAFPKVVVAPSQTESVPVIEDSVAYTVTTVVARQPEDNV